MHMHTHTIARTIISLNTTPTLPLQIFRSYNYNILPLILLIQKPYSCFFKRVISYQGGLRYINVELSSKHLKRLQWEGLLQPLICRSLKKCLSFQLLRGRVYTKSYCHIYINRIFERFILNLLPILDSENFNSLSWLQFLQGATIT